MNLRTLVMPIQLLLLLPSLLFNNSIAGTHPAEFLWHQPYDDYRLLSTFYLLPTPACEAYSRQHYPPGLFNVIAVPNNPFNPNIASSAGCYYTQPNGQVTAFTYINYEAVCFTNDNIFIGLAFGQPCVDSCVAPAVFSNDTKTCVNPERYSITPQNPLANLEPSGTTDVNANTSKTFYAQVIDVQTSRPKAGMQVKFSVDVIANSGGHNHDDTLRPKGTLSGGSCTADGVSAIVCTTDPNGYAYFTFNTPQVSGTYTITAKCASPTCINQASGNIDVKVDGLATIPASQFYTFIGVTDFHPDNHYLIPEAASVLWSMAVSYQFEQRFKLNGVTPPPLNLNDASLIWGGVFDIKADWYDPHNEHRRGTVIDIRANSNTGAIAPANFDAFMRLAYLYGANAKIHNAGETTQHFHVRLLSRGE